MITNVAHAWNWARVATRTPDHFRRTAAGHPYPCRWGGGSACDDFYIDFDRQEVTCPRGRTNASWHGSYPPSSPTAAR